MQFYTLSTIGQFHLNYDEDFFIIAELDSYRYVMAVMDGCSMGRESHFAATLLGKILRKVAKELSFQFFVQKTTLGLEPCLRKVMAATFQNVQQLQHSLMLEQEELLSTLLLGIYDQAHQQAEILAIGDGLICCNGLLYEFEQDNRPDYLGYHLHEDFDEWYDLQTQRLSFSKIEDLSLVTDGIFSFKPFNDQAYPKINEVEIIDAFLLNQAGKSQELMLRQQLIQLETHHGLRPSDDLTIVRLIA